MVSDAMKKAQKKYREKNKIKYLEYSKKSRMKHYYNNRNYHKVDDMSTSFRNLFLI